MKLKNNILNNKYFSEAKPIVEKLNEKGFDSYFVGGSVRDLLLDRKIHDVDITTAAEPKEIKEIFPNSIDNYSGEKHGTVLVNYSGKPYEITTFRVDGIYEDGRRPETVSFTRDIKNDLERRDFTINSFALNQNGNILDFFNGKNDLENKLIRAVGDPNKRFIEDSLRVFRAFRFSSQLNFKIEENTLKAIEKTSYLLDRIAIERIREELLKIIKSTNRMITLKQMVDLNIFYYVSKELNEYFKKELLTLNKVLGNKEIKNNDTVWIILSLLNSNFDLGTLFKLSNSTKNKIKIANKINKLLKNNKLENISNFELIDIAKKNENNEIIESLSLLNPKINLGEEVLKRREDISIFSENELSINGIDIINEFPNLAKNKIGILKKKAFRSVLNNKVSNKKEDIINFLKNDYNNIS